jgi:polyribonucleotide nucleotidyltransferase
MSIDDKINEALGISTEQKPATKQIIKKEYTPPVPRIEDKEKEDVDNDYKYSRENYYNLIERGQDAIQGILDIAQESQHPRAYEVAGNLIKQVADTVDKLQDLQGKLKNLKEVPNKTTANIKQALFVGSSAELHKMLKNKNKTIESEEDKSFSEQLQENLEPINE